MEIHGKLRDNYCFNGGGGVPMADTRYFLRWFFWVNYVGGISDLFRRYLDVVYRWGGGRFQSWKSTGTMQRREELRRRNINVRVPLWSIQFNRFHYCVIGFTYQTFQHFPFGYAETFCKSFSWSCFFCSVGDNMLAALDAVPDGRSWS
jgi:hypothetical protein